MSIFRDDDSTAMVKKGGDCLGYSGYKHTRGEKVVAFCDRKCNVISSMTIEQCIINKSPNVQINISPNS